MEPDCLGGRIGSTPELDLLQVYVCMRTIGGKDNRGVGLRRAGGSGACCRRDDAGAPAALAGGGAAAYRSGDDDPLQSNGKRHMEFLTRRAALVLGGLSALALTTGLGPAPVPARAADQSGLHVSGAWARASIGTLDRSAAYFEVMNHGTSADRLIGAKADVGTAAELHTTITENDVVRMRKLNDGIEVPAGDTLKFEPGGNHVMLLGLKQPLKEGDSFPMTLVFEKAGELKVDVAVRKGAPGGGHAHHKH